MGNKNFQEIQEIGFTSLIKKFTGYTGSVNQSVLKGIGDDASVLKSENGKVICTTSEIFLEGVHFDLTYTPFHHLGYKLVTAAVSDIYAMNASPEQLLVSIAIPNKYSVQMMEQLYKGIDAACKDYKIQLTGGDTTASHQVLSISVTCTGVAAEKDIVYRSGAKVDDLICVTGDFGAALAGLRILLREKKEWKENPDSNFQPELEDYEYVVQRQLVPVARMDYHEALGKSDVKIHALMDVTQGLVADLRSMANASGVGLTLYSPAVPISLDTRKVADEMKEDVDKYAFYGGEDFEMLFTLSEPNVEKFKTNFDDFSVIGKVTDQDKLLKINTGEDKTIEIEL
jgi:thiamine-monophosphate kinase